MGSVHSKISGSASSRPRGWQHIPMKISTYIAPPLCNTPRKCHAAPTTYAPLLLGRSPRKIAITTLRSHRRELDQFSTSKQHASAKRHRQCFCPFRKDAPPHTHFLWYLDHKYKQNYYQKNIGALIWKFFLPTCIPTSNLFRMQVQTTVPLIIYTHTPQADSLMAPPCPPNLVFFGNASPLSGARHCCPHT